MNKYYSFPQPSSSAFEKVLQGKKRKRKKMRYKGIDQLPSRINKRRQKNLEIMGLEILKYVSLSYIQLLKINYELF